MFYANLIPTSQFSEQLRTRGFYIAKRVLSNKSIDDMRSFWLSKIKLGHVNRKFVRGEMVLGESNFLSFSKINEWCMFRNFDFLWNKPTHHDTTNICIEIHKFRNRVQELDIDYGLKFNEENAGIYISTSLYPENIGMLEKHSDSHGKDTSPIIHFMLPLTFKGHDFESGGLYIVDKQGITVDIDSLVEKGDLIFFDGTCQHGVNTILGSKNIGRLAVFAIPCFFKRDSNYLVFKRSLKIEFYEILSRLKVLPLIRDLKRKLTK
jgi:hypothetical protein